MTNELIELLEYMICFLPDDPSQECAKHLLEKAIEAHKRENAIDCTPPKNRRIYG